MLIIKISTHPCYPRNIDRFSRDEAETFFEKKFQNGRLKKLFQTHQCGSTYMVVNLLDVRSKTGKKNPFLLEDLKKPKFPSEIA